MLKHNLRELLRHDFNSAENGLTCRAIALCQLQGDFPRSSDTFEFPDDRSLWSTGGWSERRALTPGASCLVSSCAPAGWSGGGRNPSGPTIPSDSWATADSASTAKSKNCSTT